MEKKEPNNEQGRKNRFNTIPNSLLLNVVKESNNFPLKLPCSIPLNQLVSFYNRYWNNELTDDEGDSSF